MENCTKRKNMIRHHEKLSNGQVLSITISKHTPDSPHLGSFKIYSVGICIGKNRKSNNRWFLCKSKKYDKRQTGKCGLEALRLALKYILEFRNSMNKNEELQIGWADEKRKRTYKYLLRYDFLLANENDCYWSRSPEYWEKSYD
jgi:hypothetical protein